MSQGAAATPAVFLHTGWRSGGTWLWSQCRGVGRVRGFYEPLHEAAAHLSRSDIDRIRPESWRSSHGHTPPYFEEYRSLISKGGRGVALYQPRFAFDSYFLRADEADPALEAYISALLAVTTAYDQVAVLKFCRSLGRVAWFEQHFPTALHALMVRNPLQQWRSGHRLLVRERNRYFTIAPALVLARNAHHPLVRQAASVLDVRLPALHSMDTAYGFETVWRSMKRQNVTDRYRTFLAYWTVSTITALQGHASVINQDLLVTDRNHRDAVEAALQTRIGVRIALAPLPPPQPDIDGPSHADMRDAHDAAAALVEAEAAALRPDRQFTILQLLDTFRVAATRQPVILKTVEPLPLPRSPGVVDRLGTAAEVVFARALQPLRRLHGTVSAWIRRR